MKRFHLVSIAILLPLAVGADSAADYVNFINQVQQGDPSTELDDLVHYLPVGAEGTQISPEGVSEDGDRFELWSIHNTTTVEYLLDEQLVTAFTPNADVVILTGDPYGPVRRTRSDQSFQVQVTVSGLLDPTDPAYPTAPEAAKMVEYIHTTFAYPEGSHSLEGVSNPVGTLVAEGTMVDNTTATVTFNVTNLTGADLTQVEGEEVFTISALAAYGVEKSILDSERVQIWPVAQASFSGYDPNEYYEKVPPITVNMIDLYPDSTTYVRIYPGPPQTNPADAVMISASRVVIEDSIPQDRTVLLSDLDRHFVTEGFHTMEILHQTPFGIDLIHSGSIRVDRTVEFVGGIVTSD